MLYLALAAIAHPRNHLDLYFVLVFPAALFAFGFARHAGLRAALLCGLLFRMTMVVGPPDLSGDIYRYVWDGHVAAAGISPYAAPPDSPRLVPLRDANWARVEHRDARTIYPPAAEWLFRVAAVTPWPRQLLQVVFLLADLLCVVLLARFPRGRFAAALYAAFPLPIVESAGAGHLDSVGVALMLAALLWIRKGNAIGGGIALGFSIMVKYVAGLAILPFLFRRKLLFLLPCALVVAGLWFLGGAAGASPASGVSNFATRWEGNAVIFPAIRKVVEMEQWPARAKVAYARWKSHQKSSAPWMQEVWSCFYSDFFARAITALLLAVGLVFCAWRFRDPVAATAASIGLLLVLSPVLEPWYLLWIFPFAALYRKASFLYLSFAVPLSYGLLYRCALGPSAILAFEFIPFFVLLFRDLFGRALVTPWKAT